MSLLLIVLSAGGSMAYAADAKADGNSDHTNWNFVEMHHRNAYIAQQIKNLDYARYERIAKDLNAADREAWQSLFIGLKGKHLKVFPLFDRLLIYTDKENHSIRVVATDPLTLSVDGDAPVVVDSKNLVHSLQIQRSKTSAF